MEHFKAVLAELGQEIESLDAVIDNLKKKAEAEVIDLSGEIHTLEQFSHAFVLLGAQAVETAVDETKSGGDAAPAGNSETTQQSITETQNAQTAAVDGTPAATTDDRSGDATTDEDEAAKKAEDTATSDGERADAAKSDDADADATKADDADADAAAAKAPSDDKVDATPPADRGTAPAE